MYFNPKWLVAALSGAFSNCVITKMEFEFEKSFDEAGAYSYDNQSIPPRSKGLSIGPTTTTPKLSKSEIVCHLAQCDDPQNSAKNHENVWKWQISVLVSFTLAKPMISCFLHNYGFFERHGCFFSDLKTPQNANFKTFCITTFLHPL